MADRLEEIRARVGAVPPGEWSADCDGYDHWWGVRLNKWLCCGVSFHPDSGLATVDDANESVVAALFANAPDDIRFLLAEVERLRAERDALRLALQDLAEDNPSMAALNRARALLGGQSDGR